MQLLGLTVTVFTGIATTLVTQVTFYCYGCAPHQ